MRNIILYFTPYILKTECNLSITINDEIINMIYFTLIYSVRHTLLFKLHSKYDV